MGVADGIGASFGDPGEEGLGSQGAIDAGTGVEAISRDSAHQRIDHLALEWCSERIGRT
jgi:hypothetical protein